MGDRHTRRVWSEHVPLADLCAERTLRPLAERGIELLVAIAPGRSADLPAVVEACRERGVRVGVWPMLERRHGRWPSAANLDRWRAFADATVAHLDARGLGPDVMAVDLEPPLEELEGLLRGHLRTVGRWLGRTGVDAARKSLAAWVRALGGGGVETYAAVMPPVLGDRAGGRGWERALGTPIDGVDFDRVAPMLYTSLLEGYSRGTVRRRDALALLGVGARASRRRWGGRAGICLGAAGPGVLGDEPRWASVDALAEDVAEARAAGIEDIAAFDLTGMLARPPVEAWLDALALTEAAARPAPLTARAALLAGGVRAAGRVIGRR